MRLSRRSRSVSNLYFPFQVFVPRDYPHPPFFLVRSILLFRLSSHFPLHFGSPLLAADVRVFLSTRRSVGDRSQIVITNLGLRRINDRYLSKKFPSINKLVIRIFFRIYFFGRFFNNVHVFIIRTCLFNIRLKI